MAKIREHAFGLDDAQVEAREGGPRAMRVYVRLPAAKKALQDDVACLLAQFLFEAVVDPPPAA